MTASKSARSRFWVWTTSGKEPLPQPFRDDETMARRLFDRLDKQPCVADVGSGRWCFTFDSQATPERAQELGTFQLGGLPFRLVATGSSRNASGGTDLVSVAIYPAPRPAASGK
jgi:hypothetical protein